MEILDYARPLIVAERALRDMYNDALHRNYDGAHEKGMQAIVEIRLALAAINNEKAKQ